MVTSSLLHWYELVIRDGGDPRSADFPFIASPVPLLIIIVSYLYFVCKVGPDYMRDRKPYSLKTIITIYNIAQVLSCAYFIYALLEAGWWKDYSLGCQPVDTSHSPKALRMVSACWWVMILKLSEFLETVFFVLRKKQNQISSLHLYHHVSTLAIAWICTKYTPGGMATFPILPNCLVHIIMYSYYLVALHGGKEVQKKLVRWKQRLTILQMAQFVLMIAHAMQGLAPSCDINKYVTLTFIPNVFLVWHLFYGFYKNSYKKQRAS